MFACVEHAILGLSFSLKQSRILKPDIYKLRIVTKLPRLARVGFELTGPHPAMSMSSENYWVYHERQEAQLCGQHALNNLVQANAFSAGSLAEIAAQLDEMELAYMSQNNEGGTSSKDFLKRVAEGSGNVDESGNFSIEVLRSALMTRYNLELPSIRQRGVGDNIEITDMEGFICNRSSHWFAIRKINGRFWNLNSTNDRPVQISHFRLAAEMEGLQNEGYSVFCVVKNLPPPCSNEVMMGQGLPQYWWKEEDLLKGKSNAATRADDPWKNAGSGRRLDGKASRAGQDIAGNNKPLSEMTEEEMLQMAMKASLEETAPSEILKSYALADEPSEGAEGVVKIQFRLPDGKRAVRRFLETEQVGVIYSFVESLCSRQEIELRAGFPPKSLSSQKEQTISQAKLAGEMIHGRYV